MESANNRQQYRNRAPASRRRRKSRFGSHSGTGYWPRCPRPILRALNPTSRLARSSEIRLSTKWGRRLRPCTSLKTASVPSW